MHIDINNNGGIVIKGEPEMYFHIFDLKKSDLENLPNIIDNFPTYEVELAIPGLETIFKNYIPKMKFLGDGSCINIHASLSL